MDADTEAEIARLEKLIADLGPKESWTKSVGPDGVRNARPNAKSNARLLAVYEARIRTLKEEHHLR